MVFVLAFSSSCSEEKKKEDDKKEEKSAEKIEEKDVWNEESRNRFMQNCMTSLDEDVCRCSLEKVEKILKPSDMDRTDSEVINGISGAMNECMGM
jgi:hypothetical protein